MEKQSKSDRIRSLLASGTPAAEIAEKMGVSKAYVYSLKKPKAGTAPKAKQAKRAKQAAPKVKAKTARGNGHATADLDVFQTTVNKLVGGFRDGGGVADLIKAKSVIDLLIRYETEHGEALKAMEQMVQEVQAMGTQQSLPLPPTILPEIPQDATEQ